MLSTGRAAAVGHATGAAEELTPAPRSKWLRRTFVTLVALCVFVLVFGLLITVLGEEWVLVSLLLEASEEVPKGSGLIHVCD